MEAKSLNVRNSLPTVAGTKMSGSFRAYPSYLFAEIGRMEIVSSHVDLTLGG
jgi:hypothetical protein